MQPFVSTVAQWPDKHLVRLLKCSRTAPIQAAMRADEILGKGDRDRYAVFKRIVKAAEELLSKGRADGATLQ